VGFLFVFFIKNMKITEQNVQFGKITNIIEERNMILLIK